MILPYLIFLIFLFDNKGIDGLSCRNHEDKGVDWFFAYKIPQKNGGGYLYKTSLYPVQWALISHEIENPNSIFSKTFGPAYRSPRNFMFVMYNDVIPVGGKAKKLKNLQTDEHKVKDEDKSEKFGPSRGVLLWDEGNAIWFLHSVPRFMPNFLDGNLRFPTSYKDEGHIFLCLTVKYEDINEILIKLMVMKVKVYGHRLFRSIIFPVARGAVYPPTIVAKVATLGKAVTYEKDFFNTLETFYVRKKYAIITKKAKQTETIWEIARNRLGLKNDLTVKLGKHITNSKRQVKYYPLDMAIQMKLPEYHQVFFKIDAKNWLIESDPSNWAFSDDTECFCIGHESFGISNMVCIFDPHLRNSMLNMINVNKKIVPYKKS